MEKSFFGRLMAMIAMVAIAFALVACGGGGSGGPAAGGATGTTVGATASATCTDGTIKVAATAALAAAACPGGTTTIPTVVCVAPQMATYANTCISPPAITGYTWNNTLKAWVADIGTLVTGVNELPVACDVIGDACWNASVANGLIKFANTGLVMTGVNTRPVVFAYFRTQATASGLAVYNTNPLFADVQATSIAAGQTTRNGGSVPAISSAKGTAIGLKITDTIGGCFERIWTGAGVGTQAATCPI